MQGAGIEEENIGMTTWEKVLCNVFPSAVYSYLLLQHSCLESRLSTVLLLSIFTQKQKFVLQPSVNLLRPSR